MKTSLLCFLMVGIVFIRTSSADEAEEDAKQIVGTWVITELVVNGNEVKAENFAKIRIVNEAGNLWSLQVDGKEISRGTSVYDTSQTPKLVDFYPTDGEGRDKHLLGIYELNENTRKLCFVESGTNRPVEFAAPQGSDQTLVTFKRLKEE